MNDVVVTGLGACCAIGKEIDDLIRALEEGQSGIEAPDDEVGFLPVSGIGRCTLDVRPLLKRRKDRKLLPRAAHLAIFAAHRAYGTDRSEDTALFLGVGREPPEAETETALVVSMTDGKLDPAKLYTDGIAVYPPLSPLKTLPNLVLAHVAIQLDCQGEGGTRAGTASAGLAALVAGYQAIMEGRSDIVLAGAADSLVAPGSARDAVRTGQVPVDSAPGEAAAFLRLESGQRARARGAKIWAVLEHGALGAGEGEPWVSPLSEQTGICGTADAPLWIALQMAQGLSGDLQVSEASGACSRLSWSANKERERA